MRTLDLFCGGGGSSFGARAAGAKIVGGIDLWDLATRTFKHNFPTATVKTSKLEDIDPEAFKQEIGSIELLLASPECTNHTCAKGAAPRSEESRATALQAIRFAKVFEPDWIVMENVVHMRPWSRYGEMKAELRGMGYSIKELILDAAYFSVPQSRRRLFLVCGKNGTVNFEVPKRKTTKTVNTILDKSGTWKTSKLFSEKRADATIERAERAFAEIGHDKPFLIVYYGSDGSGGWQPLDRPLRTITTVDRFALVEPSENGHTMRMLQVPELARAMGFTKNYHMPFGTRRQRVHMLGNGVCPPVMKWVVKNIMETSTETVRSCQVELLEPEYQTPPDPITGHAVALMA